MRKQIAFVFPGQGSQSVGMLAGLAAEHPLVTDTFAEASDALGRDLWKLVSEGPKDDLDRTENTQPAMLSAGVAVWRVWKERGGEPPQWMAGHSLGEYSALTCSEALEFGDAVGIVAERGRLMQEAVPQGSGAMAAVLGLSDEQVRAVCIEAAGDQVLEPVNFNSPGQVVVAGDADAVGRALVAAKGAGAKRAVRLPVSVPSHCALMRPAAERLGERLMEVAISPPKVPVIHNVSVAAESDPAKIRELLVRQLYSPVRWAETVQLVADEGATVLVEAGPGKVLAGLTKRIDRRLGSQAVFDTKGLTAALEATQNA